MRTQAGTYTPIPVRALRTCVRLGARAEINALKGGVFFWGDDSRKKSVNLITQSSTIIWSFRVKFNSRAEWTLTEAAAIVDVVQHIRRTDQLSVLLLYDFTYT